MHYTIFYSQNAQPNTFTSQHLIKFIFTTQHICTTHNLFAYFKFTLIKINLYSSKIQNNPSVFKTSKKHNKPKSIIIIINRTYINETKTFIRSKKIKKDICKIFTRNFNGKEKKKKAAGPGAERPVEGEVVWWGVFTQEPVRYRPPGPSLNCTMRCLKTAIRCPWGSSG